MIFEPLRGAEHGPGPAPLKALAVPDQPRYLTTDDMGVSWFAARCPYASMPPMLCPTQ